MAAAASRSTIRGELCVLRFRRDSALGNEWDWVGTRGERGERARGRGSLGHGVLGGPIRKSSNWGEILKLESIS